MANILIRRFDDRIAKEKKYLDDAVSAVQRVYNGFKALGINVNVTELTELINTFNSPAYQNTRPTSSIPASLMLQAKIQPKPVQETMGFLEEFVKDKLFPSVKASFNNAAILDSKIREMIAVPDLSEVEEALKGSQAMYNSVDPRVPLKAAHFQLTGDVVSRAGNAYAEIEARHTHYTRNERGINVMNTLTALCQALNNYKTLTGEDMDRFNKHYPETSALRGVEQSNAGYIPSLDYIRKFERIA